MHYLSEEHIGLFLVQFAVLLGSARLLSLWLSRFRWPAITGEMLVGVLFGPTVFGRLWPDLWTWLFPRDPIQQNMLETVSWLGLLFLLLETGLELDLSAAWRRGRQALVIAISDLVIPFVIAGVFAFFLAMDYPQSNRLTFVLFLATTMTISAMPIAIRIMQETFLFKTELGTLILSALSINDLVGWLVFTVVLGMFSKHGTGLGEALRIFVVVLVLTVVALTLGSRLISLILGRMEEKGRLSPGHTLTIVAVVGAIMGEITQSIGIHALFGFFLAGAMISSCRAVSEFVRSVISQMVHALLVPLFFVNIGLKLDFFVSFDWMLVITFSIIGIGGRFLGALWGARLAGLGKKDELVIALPHVPGGAMEVVLALLALESGLIGTKIFVAIVVSAVFSSIVAGPMLAWVVSNKLSHFKLLDFLTPDLIFKVEGEADKKGVIRTILEELSRKRKLPISKEELFSLVWSREKELSTGLGFGVAVPHARVEGISKPIMALAVLDRPVPWDAPDDKPVDVVFLILTPKEAYELQLKILSQIACLVSRHGLADKIRQAGSRSEVIGIIKESMVKSVF